MSRENIDKLLHQLKAELAADEQETPEVLELLERLEINLDKTQSSASDTSNDIVDTALLLESHFAAEFPLAEKTMREIINILGRMGI